MKIRNAGGALALAGVLAAAGCDSLRGPDPDVLARAGTLELRVEEAAALLAEQDQLPPQREVVTALADLWIDYVLLARAAARDATLASVDLGPLVRLQEEQEVILRLRDRVIQVDTTVTDEELREAFSREAPGVAVRARHILLTYPDGSTPAQRDSVRAFAGALRQELLGGADFAALARQHSRDPGSAAQGGDLGFFQRGEMVASFDSAAFALPLGQVSGLVESPFGVHLIRVEERQTPDFDSLRDDFRVRYIGMRIQEAESRYIESVEGPADIRVSPEAADIVRGLAERPQTNLPRRAARRALATFRGGSYTAGDFQEWIRGQSPAYRSQFAFAQDEQLEGLVRSLALGQVLVVKAREEGVDLTPEERRELVDGARERFTEAARGMGLAGIEPGPGESMDQAIARTVRETLASMLRGERDVIPLGAVAYSLRKVEKGQVFDAAVTRTVARITQLRNARGPNVPPQLQAPGLEPGMPLPPGSP